MTISLDEVSELKNALSPLLDECTFEEAEYGQSGARVIRVLMPGGDIAYVKYASGAFAEELREEHERIGWLTAQTRIPVPEVISYASTSNATILLTKALVGRNAADAASADPTTIVAEMARALRELHAIAPEDCPFDERLHLRLKQALARMEAGLVDEEDFDQARQGMRVRDVYEQLLSRIPAAEQLVVTHGDACPENFIFRGDAFVGFIDCGRVGLADKYQDLALASRNIDALFGPELADQFFIEYGEPNPSPVKIEYYRILDEFF
ncbi:APH(3') family aminoglycoside O-phosphotransferase [Pseudoxanthomonas wuyuanensis]|uniref:Aminoglycoside 3'-phosphotransferase n=1 Tax=Pseudoxanthomonas wuyuanensis TaxID=1073196 RepID=A0A286CWL5_9GAMM|nr:APH(3') family aminoglycoside O-phosphotransferase [Pseudoxanthomonas wuyuanensis]KAF1720927.1 aminoglycoside 3'-phosphotransferase [Pseudoxanthomonas wuyuanensis]SOD50754.1 aminoglycoside 3'-phosphotransferase-2/aminoglycoside 3'-phosphotransferase-9 [Pseudoxanthomonas wuyuanensis]